MDLADLRSEAQRAVTDRAYRAVERRFPGDPRDGGYIVGWSERLVLLHSFSDFDHRGWNIMRLEDLVDLQRDKRDEFFGQVLEREGRVAREPPYPVNLWTVQTALKSVLAAGRLAIIECETMSGDDDDFVLAQLLGVDDEAVEVRPLDSMGQWMETESIELSIITRVQLESPYALMLARHAAPLPAGD